jgi:hypothetical protein
MDATRRRGRAIGSAEWCWIITSPLRKGTGGSKPNQSTHRDYNVGWQSDPSPKPPPTTPTRRKRTPLGSRMAASTRVGRLFDTIRCFLRRLFYDDPNIYRAADLLIWCHGTNANIEASRIADAMRGFGDRDEHAFWITVGQAIIELEAPSRPSQPRPSRRFSTSWNNDNSR